jgi:hypothetical protein
MTIAEAFLQNLANWQPAPGRQTLVVSEGPSRPVVSLTVERREELSCLVWEMSVRQRPTAPGSAGLAAWAEHLAEHVTGLRETLQVVEIDSLRNEALLRSTIPQRTADDVFYHEVWLSGCGEAMLRRYHARTQAGTRRAQIPFAATHDVLAKLAGDLSAD